MYDLPFKEKISPVTALEPRMLRPTCPCCGGSNGIRRAFRKFDKFSLDTYIKPWESLTKGKKPKKKDHR